MIAILHWQHEEHIISALNAISSDAAAIVLLFHVLTCHTFCVSLLLVNEGDTMDAAVPSCVCLPSPCFTSPRFSLCSLFLSHQTGKMGGEPYRAAGITGKGQVCGIADSGLNDLSCFFYDGPSPPSLSSQASSQSSSSSSSRFSTSSGYRGVLTNRSGVIEPFRRKVIQYVAYADMTDEIGEMQRVTDVT
jgi:hypothetical protein